MLASLSAAIEGGYAVGGIAELPKSFREATLQDFTR
jgi:hypothetical protein